MTAEARDPATATTGVPFLGYEPNDTYLRALLRTLDAFCPATTHRRPRIVDLGCNIGTYSFAFADAGYDVLGIEGRPTNLEKALATAAQRTGPSPRFEQEDVWNLPAFGMFDVVFAAGILYHLDRPVEFLRLLGSVTTRLAIVQTHFAAPEGSTVDGRYLSECAWNEGRLGRWFREWSPDETPEQVEARSWASIGNPRSFWLDKKHLLESIRQAGFASVYEQYDFLDDIVADDYIERRSRSLFIGLKPR